jgi:hypothetical protein
MNGEANERPKSQGEAQAMSGSTENTAHGASETPSRREIALNLTTVRSMLPLVRRIVEDLVQDHQRLAQLQAEQERLDRQRRDLAWPERARRYQVQEDVAATDRRLQEALAELASLGVVLLVPEEGRVGFPTIVNSRTAFFSWRPGETSVSCWHFPGETVRRPIPASWAKVAPIRHSSKREGSA